MAPALAMVAVAAAIRHWHGPPVSRAGPYERRTHAIVLSNATAQTIQPGAAVTFDVVKLHTGCGEFHRAGSGSVRLRAGLYAFDFTGNVGGAAGTQPNPAIAIDGDTLLETAMTETVALATDVRNVHASTKFRNRFGGPTVTVVNTGSTPVELTANPALAVKREA